MTVRELGKYAIAVAIVALIGAFGYYQYRLSGVRAAMAKPALNRELTMPPVVCTGATSGFRAYSSIQSYYAHGSFRADAVSKDLGVRSVGHLLVTPEKEFYLWSDDNPIGTMFKIDPAADAHDDDLDLLSKLNMDISVLEDGTCSIWWNPDDSLFRVPASVQFRQIGQ